MIAKLGLSTGEVAATSLSRSVLPSMAKYVTQNVIWNMIMDCNCDSSTLATIVAHEPSPTSTHNIIHWNQTIRSGKFAAFDYGAEQNAKLYGNAQPPEYDLSKIDSTPIVVFYGQHGMLYFCKSHR